MKPKLKINGIDNLHDARYCAAVGIMLLEFDLSPESEEAVTPELVREVAPWLSGPEIVARFDYQTPDEIRARIEGLGVSRLSLPSDYHPGLITDLELPVILRVPEGSSPEAATEVSERFPEAMLEFYPPAGVPADALAMLPWVSRAIFAISDPGEVWAAMEKQGEKPFAFTLGAFFQEPTGELDYDRCDAFTDAFHSLSPA